jgi:putative acyl-CoA dehydrogenase
MPHGRDHEPPGVSDVEHPGATRTGRPRPSAAARARTRPWCLRYHMTPHPGSREPTPAARGHNVVTSDSALSRPSPVTPVARGGDDLVALGAQRDGRGARAGRWPTATSRCSGLNGPDGATASTRSGSTRRGMAHGACRRFTGSRPHRGQRTSRCGPWRTRSRGLHGAHGPTRSGPQAARISRTYAAVPHSGSTRALAKEWTRRWRPRRNPGSGRWPFQRGALAGMGMTEAGAAPTSGPTSPRRRRPSMEAEYTLHGPQVVSPPPPMNDVLPRARPGARRTYLLRAPPRPARRHSQPARRASGSRTSSATGPTRRRSWSSTDAGRCGSATRVAGCRTIIEMVGRDPARLRARGRRRSCATRSTRRPWHVAHRSAFGGLLPTSRSCRTSSRPGGRDRGRHRAGLRLAAAGRLPADPQEAALRRIALPLAKFWVCKRTAGLRGRGAGVSRRQRVRRGVRTAAALPRGAVELRVGGLGQRQRARRTARTRPEPEVLGAWITEVGHARGADERLDRAVEDTLACSATPALPRSAPGGWPVGWRPASRARCW